MKFMDEYKVTYSDGTTQNQSRVNWGQSTGNLFYIGILLFLALASVPFLFLIPFYFISKKYVSLKKYVNEKSKEFTNSELKENGFKNFGHLYSNTMLKFILFTCILACIIFFIEYNSFQNGKVFKDILGLMFQNSILLVLIYPLFFILMNKNNAIINSLLEINKNSFINKFPISHILFLVLTSLFLYYTNNSNILDSDTITVWFFKDSYIGLDFELFLMFLVVMLFFIYYDLYINYYKRNPKSIVFFISFNFFVFITLVYMVKELNFLNDIFGNLYHINDKKDLLILLISNIISFCCYSLFKFRKDKKELSEDNNMEEDTDFRFNGFKLKNLIQTYIITLLLVQFLILPVVFLGKGSSIINYYTTYLMENFLNIAVHFVTLILVVLFLIIKFIKYKVNKSKIKVKNP